MYEAPLNLLSWRLLHSRFRLTRFPPSVAAVTSFGMTVYPHLTPVNPAVFEKLRNSMATFFAPLIS